MKKRVTDLIKPLFPLLLSLLVVGWGSLGGAEISKPSISEAESIQIATEFWQQNYGVAPQDFSEFGPPQVEDTGKTWRVMAVTESHMMPPLEVEIDKETGTVMDVPRE